MSKTLPAQTNLSTTRRLFDAAVTPANARQLRNEIEALLKQNRPEGATAYLPTDAQVPDDFIPVPGEFGNDSPVGDYHASLGSSGEAQSLLIQIIQESGVFENAADDANGLDSLSHELQARLRTMPSSGLPGASGLREFLGGNPWQGLHQILQPLMRILAGIFLTRPETQFPKCLPNEKAMAELAALFASPFHKPDRRKNRRKRKGKSLSFIFGFREGGPRLPESEEDFEGLLEKEPAMA